MKREGMLPKSSNIHSQSVGLAVSDVQQAHERNEFFRQNGIAAEHPIGKNGEIMPLQFRDRNGRREAHRILGVHDRDAGYGDHAGR